MIRTLDPLRLIHPTSGFWFMERAVMYWSVECLSSFMLAELVKPAAILSFHAWPNQVFELASANFLNCHETDPIYVGPPKIIASAARSSSQAVAGKLSSASMRMVEADTSTFPSTPDGVSLKKANARQLNAKPVPLRNCQLLKL